MTNDKSDFTQGSILKKLVAFMIPVLGALILQAMYGAVDLLVVGRFGSTSGLSAVSTGSQVLNLVTFVVVQFAMGITVLIARYLGEKRPEKIGAVIGGGAVVFTIISVVLFFVNPSLFKNMVKSHFYDSFHMVIVKAVINLLSFTANTHQLVLP